MCSRRPDSSTWLVVPSRALRLHGCRFLAEVAAGDVRLEAGSMGLE